jgi:hypothetical protein
MGRAHYKHEEDKFIQNLSQETPREKTTSET